MCPKSNYLTALLIASSLLVLLLSPTTVRAYGGGVSGQKLSPPDAVRTCDPIKIELCKGIGYNVTAMPNMVGHELQTDAELQLQTFNPLIHVQCSTQLRFFLCSVYTPMCTEKLPFNIGPCRPLCESVRLRCEPVLLEFGFNWPEQLECQKFPAENNLMTMCMEGPELAQHERMPPLSPLNIYPPMTGMTGGGGGGIGSGGMVGGGVGGGAGIGSGGQQPVITNPFSQPQVPPQSQPPQRKHKNKNKPPSGVLHQNPAVVIPVVNGGVVVGGGGPPMMHRPILTGSGGTQQPSITAVGLPPVVVAAGDTARKHHYNLCLDYKYFDQYYYINRTERCAHNCSADILFTNDNKQFASAWTAIWAALCFLSTLFTISTFLMDSSGFRYPERAIIFMAANYCVFSCAYIYRLIAGRSDVSCHMDSQHNVPILIQEGLDNVNCTIVFVLLYFFGMASAVWWLILAITWFMAVGLRWPADRIDSKYTVFHFFAWILPALKTIAILVMRVVDADELTGTCYVGNQSLTTLLYFVIVPSALYLSLGAVFLIAGLICKLANNNNQKSQCCRTCIIPNRQRHGSHHSTSTNCSHASHPYPLLSGSHQTTTQGSVGPGSCHSKGTTICTGVMVNGGQLGVYQQQQPDSDKLTVRVGIFAMFYTLPAFCVLAANIYEYFSRNSWYLMTNGQIVVDDRPNVEIFTLKIFMSLVIGIKTGLWLWSNKTPFVTWKTVGRRLVQKKQPLPLYLQAANGGIGGGGGIAAHKQALIPNGNHNGGFNGCGGSGKRTRVKSGNETTV